MDFGFGGCGCTDSALLFDRDLVLGLIWFDAPDSWEDLSSASSARLAFAFAIMSLASPLAG